MTVNIADHGDAVKDNEKDEERAHGRNKPMSLSLLCQRHIHDDYKEPAAENANLGLNNDMDFVIIAYR